MKDHFAEITLWLHQYKLEALEAVLGNDVQEVMQERLIELYAELVPGRVQQEIRQRIDAENPPVKSTQKKGTER